MKLPGFETAIVDTAKITGYLLSDENSGGKSAFFFAFGFTLNRPDLLRRALFRHAQSHDVVRIAESPHGKKYIIEGDLPAPDGRSPRVRSIWIIESGKTAPRFVTAYPLEVEN